MTRRQRDHTPLSALFNTTCSVPRHYQPGKVFLTTELPDRIFRMLLAPYTSAPAIMRNSLGEDPTSRSWH